MNLGCNLHRLSQDPQQDRTSVAHSSNLFMITTVTGSFFFPVSFYPLPHSISQTNHLNPTPCLRVCSWRPGCRLQGWFLTEILLSLNGYQTQKEISTNFMGIQQHTICLLKTNDNALRQRQSQTFFQLLSFLPGNKYGHWLLDCLSNNELKSLLHTGSICWSKSAFSAHVFRKLPHLCSRL